MTQNKCLFAVAVGTAIAVITEDAKAGVVAGCLTAGAFLVDEHDDDKMVAGIATALFHWIRPGRLSRGEK